MQYSVLSFIICARRLSHNSDNALFTSSSICRIKKQKWFTNNLNPFSIRIECTIEYSLDIDILCW